MPETLSPVAGRGNRRTLAADIIIANAPDPVFVCDLEGKILEANDAVSRLLGLRRDEVLEQSISQFIGQDEAREFVVPSGRWSNEASPATSGCIRVVPRAR